MTADNLGLLLLPGLVGLALYAWYAFALSRLFPKLGAQGWKGWVPVLNEIEILVRGGVPGWSVVFYFIPVVQLYGIYLKALAVHRINESFGRGAGFTVLGIFLPPVWATLLASGRMPASGDYDRRVERLMSAPEVAPVRYADALGTGYAAEPPRPPSAPERISFPSFAASEPPQSGPPLFITAPPAPAPVTPEPVTAEPVPAPEPGTVYFPWAQSPQQPEPAAATPDAPAPDAPAPDAPAPDLEPTVIANRRTAPDDDEAERTIVVERRQRVPWRLVTDGGHVIPLSTSTVLLGRKPAAAEGIEVIAVPDSTKTLSKNHARLELGDDGIWTVHDLDSTNGVIIIEPDGTETLLPQGGSAAVPGRFVLGKVGMRVTVEDLEETR